MHIAFPLPKVAVSYTSEWLAKMFPLGSVMVIKEPQTRFAPIGTFPEIVVGMPNDVVYLLNDGGVNWSTAPPVSSRPGWGL